VSEPPSPAGRLKSFVKDAGIPRVIIAGFLVLIFTIAALTGMDLAALTSDSLSRIGRNGILVLALLPAIQGGLGLNFGLPLGVICGLVGCVAALYAGLPGWSGLFAAALLGILIAVPVGWVYGLLLNRTRGQEMMVGTYVGFAVVSVMSIFWLLAPYNARLVWAVGGKGLRTTLTLTGLYDKILDRWLALRLGTFTVPTGTLLCFGLFCFLVWLFFRTQAGLSISAAGDSPRFARTAGIEDRKTRVHAAILTTTLAALGIVVFSQSYGFVQLYQAPLMMAFPAVACILIGGASVVRAKIRHVVIGTVLFQTILTTALPVTSQLIEGDISETARLVIQNGMILYALTRREGRG
jgi:simple sugar transport system permease protein